MLHPEKTERGYELADDTGTFKSDSIVYPTKKAAKIAASIANIREQRFRRRLEKFVRILHTPALDRELYDALQRKMVALPGGMNHPDFYELWKQSEIVKNRHGGRVPGN